MTPVEANSPSTDIGAALQPLLAPLVQQATDATVATLKADITALRDQLAGLETPAEGGVLQVGASVVSRVETDPWLQRALALTITGAIVLGALIVLVGYMAGNPEAAKIIAGVPAAVAGLVLLFARLDGISLPKASQA